MKRTVTVVNQANINYRSVNFGGVTFYYFVSTCNGQSIMDSVRAKCLHMRYTCEEPYNGPQGVDLLVHFNLIESRVYLLLILQSEHYISKLQSIAIFIILAREEKRMYCQKFDTKKTQFCQKEDGDDDVE